MKRWICGAMATLLLVLLAACGAQTSQPVNTVPGSGSGYTASVVSQLPSEGASSEGEQAGAAQRRDVSYYLGLDTGLFDPDKWDKKIYVDGEGLTFPIPMEDMLARGFTFEIAEHYASDIVPARENRPGYLTYGEDGWITHLMNCRVSNPGDSDVPLENCQLGTIEFDYNIVNNPDKQTDDSIRLFPWFEYGDYNADIPTKIYVDDVVEAMGVPSSVSASGESWMVLIYLYEECSVVLQCGISYEEPWTVAVATIFDQTTKPAQEVMEDYVLD